MREIRFFENVVANKIDKELFHGIPRHFQDCTTGPLGKGKDNGECPFYVKKRNGNGGLCSPRGSLQTPE